MLWPKRWFLPTRVFGPYFIYHKSSSSNGVYCYISLDDRFPTFLKNCNSAPKLPFVQVIKSLRDFWTKKYREKKSATYTRLWEISKCRRPRDLTFILWRKPTMKCKSFSWAFIKSALNSAMSSFKPRETIATEILFLLSSVEIRSNVNMSMDDDSQAMDDPEAPAQVSCSSGYHDSPLNTWRAPCNSVTLSDGVSTQPRRLHHQEAVQSDSGDSLRISERSGPTVWRAREGWSI